MSNRIRVPICMIGLLWVITGGRGAATESSPPSYAADVRPLLDAKCVRCHGDKVKKADLDLSTPAGIRNGGESGPVLAPGKPEKSALYERVHKGEMPPGKGEALAPPQIETLRHWIADGAKLPAGEAPLTQHDVLPILLRHCTACHGRHLQEAGLDLRTPAALLRGASTRSQQDRKHAIDAADVAPPVHCAQMPSASPRSTSSVRVGASGHLFAPTADRNFDSPSHASARACHASHIGPL